MECYKTYMAWNCYQYNAISTLKVLGYLIVRFNNNSPRRMAEVYYVLPYDYEKFLSFPS